jgi:heat shock protein HtpX
MALAKRITLFLVLNLLIVLTISLILSIFNIQPFLTSHGIDPISLAVFCLIWGMGGAFISLLLSKTMAKWMMGIQIIDPNTRDPNAREILETVYTMARKAGLSVMPEVGVYSSPEVNAFATGPSRRNSLVALSSGLLTRMRSEEVGGVIGHELTHVANGDMVTMTLLQGVVNAFVMFLARILAYFLTRRDDESVSGFYYLLVFVFELCFMVLGMIVVASFSRYREYRADAGGARLAGKNNMIAALKALQRTAQIEDTRQDQPAFQALKISSAPRGFTAWFATHPPLEKRIERLESLSLA